MFPLPPLLEYIIRPYRRRSCLFPDMWRRKHNRRRAMSATCLSSRHASRVGGASRSSLRPSSRPSARLCLLASYVPRASSSYPLIISPALPLPVSSAPHGFRCLPHPFASLIVSSSRPLPRIAWLPVLSTSGAGRKCDPHRREDIGGGWRTAGGVVVAACLPRMASGAMALLSVRGRPACLSWGRWAGRAVISLPHLLGSSHRLCPPRVIQSTWPRVIPSTGRGLLFLFARPPPACSSLLACRDLFPRPRPGDVRAAAWLAVAGGWLLACVPRPPFRSLAAARSLVAMRPMSLVPFVPARGVVGRFMGYSTRYLVGVGVFQNMPLNGILWLFTGIFGDVVRCLFSALLVVSFPASSCLS